MHTALGPSFLGAGRGGEIVTAPVDFHRNALLGTAKRLVAAFEALPAAPRRLAHALYGLVLVRHGGNFASTMVFLQAFRVTALPVLQRALPELRDSYHRAAESDVEAAAAAPSPAAVASTDNGASLGEGGGDASGADSKGGRRRGPLKERKATGRETGNLATLPWIDALAIFKE